MNKLFPFVLFLALSAFLSAQENQPEPSQASKNYSRFRHTPTEPTYGLAKVRAIVKKLKEDEDMNRRMPAKEYENLSVAEKFTYAMIHGEDFSQNCDMMPSFQDEHKKIFAYPPSIFDDEATWSQRQRDFLHQNRAKVVGYLRSTINANHRVGVNLKQAIQEINAVELIPDLVKIYKRDRKDHDILTLFMILMKENKYAPFLASSSCKKLYAEDADYRSFLEANAANQKLILDRAIAFYKSRQK